MTSGKSDLIQAVHHSANLSKSAAIGAIESALEIIKSTLAHGESILLSDFGKFEGKTRNPRDGRNPQSGTNVMPGARKVVTFKYSTALRKKVNGSD